MSTRENIRLIARAPLLDERYVVDRHRCHMAAKFVRVVDENRDKLHTLYWIPTLYKRLLLQILVHFYYLDWL